MNNVIITLISIILFIGCDSRKGNHKKNNAINSPKQKYLNYSKNSNFDSKQYLKDISGTWICYNYERDGEYYPDFLEDKKFNKEFAKYFYFEIKNDTIRFSIYRMPIMCEKVDLTKLTTSAKNTFDKMASKDTSTLSLNYRYRISGIDDLYYFRFRELMIEKGIQFPYFESCDLGISMWCFSNYIVFQNYGYYWYYKKGLPNNKGIVGMPSNKESRFSVNKVYTNCNIEQAVYKMIEDFPKGTEGLLAFSDEPNEKGETETWFPEKSGFNYGESTEYIWHNKNSVTVKVSQTHNSTFVFEFVKKGNDVHVKYWNDVVFPFEKGYVSYN